MYGGLGADFSRLGALAGGDGGFDPQPPANAITDPRAGHSGEYITDPRPGYEGQYITDPRI